MGSYCGICPKTTKANLARASLEGISYSITPNYKHVEATVKRDNYGAWSCRSSSSTLFQLLSYIQKKKCEFQQKVNTPPQLECE